MRDPKILPENYIRFVREGRHVCREYAGGGRRRQCQYSTEARAQEHVDQANASMARARAILASARKAAQGEAQ